MRKNGFATLLLALSASILTCLAASVSAQESGGDAASDFARTLGMNARAFLQQPSQTQISSALSFQEKREAVPKNLKDYYNYLERNPLLQYLKSNPDVNMFHVLLWNSFALDMTSLDHTTKNDKDPSDPSKPFIEAGYQEQFGPARSSRAMAIAHLAMFEAANTISHMYDSYKAPGDMQDVHAKITGRLGLPESELKKASVAATVSYAAYTSLSKLYPSKQSVLDADIEQSMILIRLAQDTPEQIEIGKKIGITAASIIFDLRANDNSQVQGANSSACGTPMHSTCLEPRFSTLTPDPSKPFAWQPDPILPIATQLGGTWPSVTPFVLKPHQFIGKNSAGASYLIVGSGPNSRTTSPNDTDQDFVQSLNGGAYGPLRKDPRSGSKMLSDKYGVRQFGSARSSKRDDDLTARGVYWGYDGTALLCAPPRLYNMIATSIALSRQNHSALSALGMARYLAIVNITLADAAIASWDGKYAFSVARPVTYIRYKNPTAVHEGSIDSTWAPLGQAATNGALPNLTPAFPAYPSGHAVFGGALFEMMSKFYGLNKTDPATKFSFVSDEYNGVNHGSNGVARKRVDVTFRSFEAAEWENAESRIWLGIHWQRDADDGIALGNEVADAVYPQLFKKLP